MQLHIQPGTYVVAVSGGVDSMVLLDLVAYMPDLQLVVAHFDHGIRPDSAADAQFVAQAAQRYGLPYTSERTELGPRASEAAARDARYGFLRRVQTEQGAQAILTAHHEDDALETAIINMVRGTGRKGLSALGSAHDIVRPLLQVSKQEILDYAATHQLAWREDSTNADERYLRNYVRRQVIPRMDTPARRQLLRHITSAVTANPLIDHIIEADIAAHAVDGALQRGWFISLPYDVSCEVMAVWLRGHGVRDFDRQTISRLVVAAKTAIQGRRFDVQAGYWLEVTRHGLQLACSHPS